MMRQLALLLLPLTALFGLPSHAADIPISKLVFHTEDDADKAQELASSTLDGLEPVIYVDWKIPPDDEEEICEGLVDEPGATFQYNAFGSTHWPIFIRLAEVDVAPLSDMVCEADRSIRIRGLYYILHSNIPTARATELRPLPATVEIISNLAARGAFAE
jgi:hypothetical protein